MSGEWGYHLANVTPEEVVALVSGIVGVVMHTAVGWRVHVKRLAARAAGVNGAVGLVYDEKTVMACIFILTSGLFVLVAERAMRIPPAIAQVTRDASRTAVWSLVVISVCIALVGVYNWWMTDRIEDAANKRHDDDEEHGRAE